jgi:hypothetical protein
MNKSLTSRKVETMLANTMSRKAASRKNEQEPRWTTYLPSPLILQLVLENGWYITRIELAPSEDQHGLVYLVTFRSDSCQQDQQMVLPRNPLIQKILEENARFAIPVQASHPIEAWLSVM